MEKAYQKRLSAKRLPQKQRLLYLERGLQALKAYIKQKGSTMTQESYLEYNFRHEGVFVGEAHLTGKIDKIIVDRQQKTITIVDYKTGRKSYATWKRETKLHKYRLQLYMYRALIEGSHSFAGYRVVDAYLEFVEPDEEGLIQELHVVFDEKEYTRIKQLIQAVWQRIQAIDLPEIESYSADVNGVEAFEKDLLTDF